MCGIKIKCKALSIRGLRNVVLHEVKEINVRDDTSSHSAGNESANDSLTIPPCADCNHSLDFGPHLPIAGTLFPLGVKKSGGKPLCEVYSCQHYQVRQQVIVLIEQTRQAVA